MPTAMPPAQWTYRMALDGKGVHAEAVKIQFEKQ